MGSVLRLVMSGYRPDLKTGRVFLKPEDITAFSEAKKLLASDPEGHGYYIFDSSQVGVLKQTLEWVVPFQSWFEELPHLLKLLEEAPQEPPWDKPQVLTDAEKVAAEAVTVPDPED